MVARQEVTPPGFTPSQYGLLAMATDATASAPDHWELGVNWREVCPGGGRTYPSCPTSVSGEPRSEGVPKIEIDEVEIRGATPFTVYERISCSPVGWAEDGLQDLAERALNRVSSFQAERAFATGTAGSGADEAGVVHPHLQSDALLFDDDGRTVLDQEATVVNAAAVDPVQAFVNLEQALAECYHGEGYIHVPAGYGSALLSEDLIRLVSGRYRSSNNHTVVLGDGYPGDAPDGTEPPVGQAYFYATGQVWYYRSGIRSFPLDETLDREDNTVHALAERTYVIAYECCLIAQLAEIATV